MGIMEKVKENKEARELEKAKKIVKKHEEVEALKKEQAQPTPTIETNAEVKQMPKEQAQEITEKLQENITYFQNNYAGLFEPKDLTQVGSTGDAVQASILFGILSELKKIRELLEAQ